jgi:hypothetical protein
MTPEKSIAFSFVRERRTETDLNSPDSLPTRLLNMRLIDFKCSYIFNGVAVAAPAI